MAKKIKIQAEALSMGYYNGAVIRPGQKFQYEGLGKVPAWVKVISAEGEEAAPAEEVKSEKKPAKKVKVEKSEVDSLV